MSGYTHRLYKQHLACFACRKVWRQERLDSESAPLCPDCHQPLTDMGKDFKAPRRNATAQWAKAEALVKNGIRFSSLGTSGTIPQRLNEVEAFVEARAQSAAEQAAASERYERQRAKEQRLAEVWDRREQQRVRQYQKKLSRPAD
ncbi:hypothetical protein [Armatimonas rosea]|uniref:NAD-dependent SIR2 family protein deacetylase n=1 Tax=Armatimonas rosea TaxID=685828 RepID=A0A7W9W8Y5_ARMRO|nr:hypothetical protein [Armatimonas rosea]MBB6053253.1 NAD-dependent SIR2 family protein deacetylase [Armatimonas rosea]